VRSSAGAGCVITKEERTARSLLAYMHDHDGTLVRVISLTQVLPHAAIQARGTTVECVSQ
jgi:hypothetical protein